MRQFPEGITMGYCFHSFPGLKAGAPLRPCLCGIGTSRGIKSMPPASGLAAMKSAVTAYDNRTRHTHATRPTSRGVRRQQSNFNLSTGMAYAQSKEPKRKWPIWPWIVLSFILVALFSRIFPGDSTVPASAPPATPGLIIASPIVVSSPNPTAITTQTPVTFLPKSLTLSNNASSTATPVTALGRGVRSDEVRSMQERLITLGYLAQGQADGIFGRGTEKAVEAFQKNNGLKSDGIAGEKTLTLLYSENAKEK